MPAREDCSEVIIGSVENKRLADVPDSLSHQLTMGDTSNITQASGAAAEG